MVNIQKLVFMVLLALCVCFSITPAFAQGLGAGAQKELSEDLTDQIGNLDFQAIQNALSNAQGGNSVSFESLVKKVVAGELDLSPKALFGELLGMVFSEIRRNGGLMRNLLVICVLSALLKALTESFGNKAVGELGFYVCYVVLIMVLFTTFDTAVTLTRDLIGILTQFMQACIPLLISLMVMSGTAGAPFVFSPTLTLLVNVVTIFVGNILTPIVVLGAGIEIVNYITEKEILSNFAALFKNICTWSLKGIAFIFVSVLTLQKISAPILNNVVAKSAKMAVGAVPVVGQVLNGAWDMVFMWAGAMKSGVMVAFIIIVVIICIMPVVKVIVLLFIFKLTAALIQPICDERIVKCIDAIGSFTLLLLGCLMTVIVMFVLSVVVLLSF